MAHSKTLKLQQPEWHDQLTSTNSVLIERLRGGDSLPHGFILAARDQTAGRGRFDRRWETCPGRDLTFSFLYSKSVPFERIVSLPMALAIGVAEYISDLGPSADVKWPNDVLVNGRKVSGILAESSANQLVIGIGLNVNMRALDAEAIDRPATSLQIETGRNYEVSDVLDVLLTFLERRLADWEEGGFNAISAAWCDRCYQLGQKVEVGDGDQLQTGILAGFGTAGQLILRKDSSEEVEIWVGDVAFD